MLIKRILLIAGLMLAGFIVTTLSIWSLAFNADSSNVTTWSGAWFIARLPVLIGVLMIIAGFRLLSSTRVGRPVDALSDDPAP